MLQVVTVSLKDIGSSKRMIKTYTIRSSNVFVIHQTKQINFFVYEEDHKRFYPIRVLVAIRHNGFMFSSA